MTAASRSIRSTAALVIATAALAAVGISATFGGGDARTRETPAPDWFRPIAEHYDLNPAITPETDFAELHFGNAGP